MIKATFITVCILSWSTFLWAGFAGALDQSTVDYSGKYINKTAPNEILRLNSNGTCSFVEQGRYFSGQYSVKNEVLTLRLAGQAEVTARFRDANTLEDKEGNVLIKEAEYVRLSKLEAEFQKLLPDVPKLRSAYSDATASLEQRVAVGRALRKTLQKLADNRSSVLPSAGDTALLADYRAELAALDRDLSTFDAVAKAERLGLIKVRLSSNQEQCAKLKPQLEVKPASTLAEWQKKSTGAVEYRRLLDERKNLMLQLDTEGESTQDLVNTLAAESEDADMITEYLNSDHKRVQILQLNTEYKAMEKHRIKLLDDYTRAFGSPRERSLLQTVLLHLESMVRNRDQARALGHEPAAKQVSELQSEIVRLERR